MSEWEHANLFMIPDRRVVITGIGVVTPIGNDLATFWRNLQNCVSRISSIQACDTTGFDCRIAGEVRDFDPKQYFSNPKDVRRTDRYTHLAMAAAKMRSRADPAGSPCEAKR